MPRSFIGTPNERVTAIGNDGLLVERYSAKRWEAIISIAPNKPTNEALANWWKVHIVSSTGRLLNAASELFVPSFGKKWQSYATFALLCTTDRGDGDALERNGTMSPVGIAMGRDGLTGRNAACC